MRALSVETEVLGPDFRHVAAWIFDLDNTLYAMDAAMHKAVEERICLFVQRHLDLAPEPAFALQKKYLRELGATLSGLVAHHGVDADIYHDFVNDIDLMGLNPDADFRSTLARLPGRKLVFTNNCGRYAARVLERLGVGDLFDEIVDARAVDYVTKPAVAAYEIALAHGGVPASQAAMFDDIARNLAPAHALGMTTVWLNTGPPRFGEAQAPESTTHIDHEIDDLTAFLQTIRIWP